MFTWAIFWFAALSGGGMASGMELTKPSIDVEVITFHEFQEKLTNAPDGIYIYNFWATWCKPCVEELPAFEKVHDKYKDEGVTVVLVSLDFVSQLESRVVPFVNERQLGPEVLLLDEPNYNAWIDRVDPSWSGSIPATWVVNAKSGEKRFFEEQLNFQELENIINSLIK